jgi:hypothetical protein
MHKALLISEVVANVSSELVSEHLLYDCQYPGTLAAFAATCRAISEPALDALWCTQLSLAPLLRCMAPDLWEGRGEGNAATSLVRHFSLGSTLDFTHLLFASSIYEGQLSPQTGRDCRVMHLASRSWGAIFMKLEMNLYL